MFEEIKVSGVFNKKIKKGFHHSVWTPICWGFGGARRLVKSLCLIICVVNRWGGEGVGGNTQASANIPTGPNDLATNERGGHGQQDGSTQSPTSAQKGSKGSNNNNNTPRETCNLDNTSELPCNKKQKQAPSHQHCHPQSSVVPCTHVHIKCVTININGSSEEKWKLEYILSLPVIQRVPVIILTQHHLSATFRPKELIVHQKYVQIGTILN